MTLKGLTLGAIAAFCTLPVSAQETEDTIIVTGTRFATPLDQVGRSVSVVTAEDIKERQQNFIYDAISTTPGVQVVRSGSFGALSSVSLRGLPSAQTLVVQDGIVLNDPSSFNNAFNFANFDTGDVERIEVLRGAQSTLYGSDAIGGVVNIITKDGRDGFGGEAFVEGGSFGTFRGGASLLGGNETASGRFTINGVTTSGFSTADEANGNTEDDGYDNITLSSKGRFAPTENIEFNVIARYQDSRSEFDDFGAQPIDGDGVAETEQLSLAGVATHTSFGGSVKNRVTISYLRTDALNMENGAVSFDALGDRVSYEYQGTFTPTEGVSVIAGAEYDQQKSEVTVGFGSSQEIETTSGFGLVQLQPVSFITLNAGVRYDSSSDFGNETTFTASTAIRIPQTGAVLRGSYSEGFRAPTAGELGFNPDLFAEFSDGWDIGIEQPFGNGRASISVTYFDQHIDDLIAFNLADLNFVNIQEFATKGIEIAATADVTNWLSISGAYTYIDAFNVSTTIAAGGQPDHRFNAQLAFRPSERLSFSTGINFNGRETFFGGVTLNSFTLVNVRGAYELTDKFEVFARIENVTDAEYQDNAGYGTAPLSAFGGVRARF